MAFCSECGSELPSGARFCANCGAPTTQTGKAFETAPPVPPASASFGATPSPVVAPPRRGMGLILPIMVAIALVAIAYLLLAPRPTPSAADTTQTAAETRPDETAAPATRAVDDASAAADVAGLDAPTVVSATTLDSAFASDPVAARARYAGPVRVSGIIATMVQPGSTPSLSMEGRTRFNYMIVNFPAGYRTRLASLAKGQVISVTCDEVRALGGTTILSGCLLP